MDIKTILIEEKNINSLAYDLIALSIITLTPALSHLVNVPLYLLEPMRIMLLISLFYTSRKNAYVLASVLPIFSYLIASHPELLKTIIIATELTLNVYLFFLLYEKINNKFFVMFLSIIASKLYYYTIKFIFISFGFINGNLITTPIYLQLIVAIGISVYAYLMLRENSKE